MSEQVKLLIAYNIRAGQENTYRRFVLEDLLPQAQELGLVPTDAWHTAYGNYPLRLLGFVADDLAACTGGTRHRPVAQPHAAARRLHDKPQPAGGAFRGGFQW